MTDAPSSSSPRLKVSEAARLLGVSDDTVRRWIDSGAYTAILAGTYARREGDDDASPSALYEEVTRALMSEAVRCEVKELQYTLTPGAMAHGRYAQCLT